MTEALPTKPRAFVLMPFDEAFNDIFEFLIKKSFETAGFHVYRADDIESQQNILSDIVTAIATADIIIADLTDSNPNVYYELGLAHAMRKPVVLLSQDIDSVPFDLRPYRVTEYDTHFAHFSEAQERLSRLAVKIASHEIVFGNPVSDFEPRAVPIDATARAGTSPELTADEGGADEPGLLDGLVDVEDGFEELIEIMTRAGEHVTEIGELAKNTAPEIEEASKENDFRRARNVLRSLGKINHEHADGLQALNAKFHVSLDRTGNALEFVVRQYLRTDEPNKQAVRDLMDELETAESSSRYAKDAIGSLVKTMETIPRVEKIFDKSRRKVIGELEKFASNIDLFISVILRVRSIAKSSDGDDPTSADA